MLAVVVIMSVVWIPAVMIVVVMEMGKIRGKGQYLKIRIQHQQFLLYKVTQPPCELHASWPSPHHCEAKQLLQHGLGSFW